MSDTIFVNDPADENQPVDYVANPLRVQLSQQQRNAYGRPYQRIDVLALAASIVARETECRELRVLVNDLRGEVAAMKSRLDIAESGSLSGRLRRALEAFADVMTDDDEPEDDY